MPEGKPQGQPPIDKGKLAQQLYPTPTSGRLAPLHINSATDISRSTGRSLWAKIALLGSLTMAPFAAALYFFVHQDDKFLGLYFLGIIPIGGGMLLIILFGVSASYLRKLGLQYPRLTAAAALLLTIPVFMVLFVSALAPLPVITLAIVVCGALGFCLSAYIFEKAKTSTATIILAAFIVGPTILFWILGIYIKKTDTNGYYTNTLAKSVDWKLIPTPLPSGITDISEDVDGTDTCANVRVHFAYYECLYRFGYPSYLSAQSQSLVDQAVATGQFRSHDWLQSDIEVMVMRDNKTLDSYKYHDGQCDISGMVYANHSGTHRRDYSIANASPAEPRKCGTTTTPTGKSLYYDSSLFKNAALVPVPNIFYFQQKSNVVVVQVGLQQPQAGTLGALYFSDPGYQPKVYEFVDSFR